MAKQPSGKSNRIDVLSELRLGLTDSEKKFDPLIAEVLKTMVTVEEQKTALLHAFTAISSCVTAIMHSYLLQQRIKTGEGTPEQFEEVREAINKMSETYAGASDYIDKWLEEEIDG